MTDPPRPRRMPPFLAMSLTNATVLSAVYLMVAAVTELVRRTLNVRWAEKLSLALEAFPARLLEWLGLLGPLRQGWLDGDLSALTVRLVYGLTAVVIIFALGVLVGTGMWLVARAGRTAQGE